MACEREISLLEQDVSRWRAPMHRGQWQGRQPEAVASNRLPSAGLQVAVTPGGATCDKSSYAGITWSAKNEKDLEACASKSLNYLGWLMGEHSATKNDHVPRAVLKLLHGPV